MILESGVRAGFIAMLTPVLDQTFRIQLPIWMIYGILTRKNIIGAKSNFEKAIGDHRTKIFIANLRKAVSH